MSSKSCPPLITTVRPLSLAPQDNRSSNGSLLYLRAPLELPYNRVVRLRMGRSVLSLRAKKTLQLRCLSVPPTQPSTPATHNSPYALSSQHN